MPLVQPAGRAIGAYARARKLTAKQRRAIAVHAATTRWRRKLEAERLAKAQAKAQGRL